MLADKLTLLSAQTTNATTSNAFNIDAYDRIAGVVEWSAGAAAGTVVIEGAYTPDYAGTWNQIMSFTWTAASRVDFDAADVSGCYVRARITSAVTSGTINVYLIRQIIGQY